MTQDRKLESDQLDKLLPALLKARAAMGSVTKDKSNPAFKSKYADLVACKEAGDPALEASGLFVSDSRTHDGQGNEELVTSLWHAESGQWLRSYTRLKPMKDDPQGYGSAMTYARRYAYLALLGLAPEDDDGNGASNPGVTPPRAGNTPPPAFDNDAARITFTEALRQSFRKAQSVAELKGIVDKNKDKMTQMGNSPHAADIAASNALRADYKEELRMREAAEAAGQHQKPAAKTLDSILNGDEIAY